MADAKQSLPDAWTCRGVALPLGARALVMGILNVTPDSFSDGGRFDVASRARARIAQMLEDGADIIDIGGESTRPGAAAVELTEEAERVLPILEMTAAEIAARDLDVAISVDTSKADLARAALKAGAHIVNDVSACTADPAMCGVVAESGAGVVLMHMRGVPRTMQDAPSYADVLGEVADYLAARTVDLESAGVRRSAIAVDPGIGFGKTLDHNLDLLAGIDRFAAMGTPVLVGLSRKRFLGEVTGRAVDDRLAGSIAMATYSILRGAQILRVHDVAETVDAVRMIAAVQAGRR